MLKAEALPRRNQTVRRKREGISHAIGQINQPSGEKKNKAIAVADWHMQGAPYQPLPCQGYDRSIEASHAQPYDGRKITRYRLSLRIVRLTPLCEVLRALANH